MIIEDAFLRRSSPQLALHLASKFRMSTYDLLVFSYAHRLYLNLLLPSDLRPRLDQLPASNPISQLNRKRLTNVIRPRAITSTPDEQSNTIDDQKQILIDRLVSRTSNDDRLISLFNTLFKISRLFRIDSSQLLNSNTHNDEWILLQRILSYPSSSFPTKIKLAENFSTQLQLENDKTCRINC